MEQKSPIRSVIQRTLSSPSVPKNKDSFIFGDVLGNGSYAQVVEVQDKETQKFYAMKIISKDYLVRNKMSNCAKLEKDVMCRLNHPNILKLYMTFQDQDNLYFIIELAKNRELMNVLTKHGAIDPSVAKITIAQIFDALSHMHSRRILHRDLKPDNILLDSHNRTKISDFGCAKIYDNDQTFASSHGSFVGTPDYISPETIKEDPIGPSSDLWSFGCIMYHVLVGEAPFHSDSVYLTLRKIEQCEYVIPSFVLPEAADLIRKLLVIKQEERIGFNEFMCDYPSIRSHPFFKGINWKLIPEMNIEEFMPNKAPAVMKRKKKKSQLCMQLNDGTEKTIMEGKIIFGQQGKEKERIMVLTDKPSLYITNLRKDSIKGEIPLLEDINMEIIDSILKISGSEMDLLLHIDPSEIISWKESIQDARKVIQMNYD